MTGSVHGDVAPWIERLARVGYVAKGVLYGTIGALAASAAMGIGGRTTDTRGAMSTVVSAPMGRAMLGIIALGLLGYAVWRVVEGVLDPERRGDDVKGLLLRASFVVRGFAHAVLAWSAMLFALGRTRFSRGGGTEGGEQARSATATAMDVPGGGEWLVWAAAAGFLGYGLYQLYKAITAKLSKQLARGEMHAEVGGWVVAVSRIGIAARGFVFMAIGWLLGRAAADHDPSQAGGIADALRALRELGQWPFMAIAVGLIAYGVYQLLNAKYRRIRAS